MMTTVSNEKATKRIRCQLCGVRDKGSSGQRKLIERIEVSVPCAGYFAAQCSQSAFGRASWGDSLLASLRVLGRYHGRCRLAAKPGTRTV
jgi:hypothetical protein